MPFATPTPSDKNWTIRMITEEDAELLSGLAITIYKQHFQHLWHDDGKWYTENVYDPDRLRTELQDLNNFHYVAWSDSQPVGYLKLKLNEKWRGLEAINCLEVERIYVLKEFGGKGLGRKLMTVAFEIAKYHNKEMVFLKAMDSSADSLLFYKKLGFDVFDTHQLNFTQMKEEYRGMLVLKRDTIAPLS